VTCGIFQNCGNHSCHIASRNWWSSRRAKW